MENEKEFKKLVRDAIEDWFNEPQKTKSKWEICKEMIIPSALIVTCLIVVGYLYYDKGQDHQSMLQSFDNGSSIYCSDSKISKDLGWVLDKTNEVFTNELKVMRTSWCTEIK